MSSARQYDYGKPADTLSEWASKVKSLQTLVDQDDAEERTRLEREIERARSERARRRGKSVDFTTSQSAASVPNTSPDLSKPEPMSLAAFIGGKAAGPRLTKKLRPDDPVDLTNYDPKPYSSKISPLAQVARGRGGPAESATSRGIPMPGMRSERETSDKAAAPSNTANSSSLQRTPPSNLSLASPIISSKESLFSSATNIGDRARQLSAPERSPLASRAIPQPAEPPLSVNKIPSTSPSLVHVTVASDVSAKVLTPSLTRLQSRGLVGERLKAAESMVKDAIPEAPAQSLINPVSPHLHNVFQEPGSTVSSSLGRKKSVLDRWPPASSSSSENFPSSLESEPASAAGTRGMTPLERARAITLEPSTPPLGRTSPIARSFEERVSILRSPNVAPEPAAVSRTASTRTKGTRVITVADKATTAQRNIPTPGLASIVTLSRRSTPNSTEASLPLSHPTKDRARKPKKASSAPVTVVEQAIADDHPSPRSSKLSEPPQFRPSTISEPTAPRPASTSTPRSHVLSPPPTAPPPRTPSPSAKGDTVATLLETWGDKVPIGVKPAPPTPRGSATPNESLRGLSTSSAPYSANKRALPGMVAPPTQSATPLEPGSVPYASSKHVGRRSPSPAPRPTAMEMARALNLVDTPSSSPDDTPASTAAGNADTSVSISRQLPRRFSYSPVAATLPAVAEVDTPPPSLSRTQGGIIAAQSNTSDVASREPPGAKALAEPITFRHTDKPSPKLDVRGMLEKAASSPPLSFDPSFKPISTDVLSIHGRSASPVTALPHVFYDTELRAIVYRSKDVVNGLASTTIWTWHGNAAKVGDGEIWKIRDLESRFGTKVISCNQGLEPLELVSLLGGVIAVRQGSAAHWSAENTTMHCVRSAPYGSNVIITEVDLHSRNFCSAYSYVISVMDVIYVWHGRGSRPNEASHAASYASLLSNDSTNIIEFKEGQEDPMFWACLGDEAWASADYWSERSHYEGRASSAVWKVGFSASPMCELLPNLNELTISHQSVYVIDGIFEVFVIVGTRARSDRASIRLALEFAKGISEDVAYNRPFSPPVHAVVLPSQLPLDLRAGHLQVADESRFNDGFVPEHMNVLGADEALSQLSKTTWMSTELEDHTFLPLGVAPSMLR